MTVLAILGAVLCFTDERCPAPPAPPAPPMRTAVASFYDDAGLTASGWHAARGVANLNLPFGTRVRFCARRCATGTVDDRGPYVAGRLFDLSMSLANAIGFPFGAGIAPVRWAVSS